MVAVTALLRAKEGREQELEALLRELAGAVASNEPGCASWWPVRSKHDSRLYLLIERYTDDGALADHANAEHYVEAIPGLMDCLEGPPQLALFDDLDAGRPD